MSSSQMELLFPPHLISVLAETRGPVWRDLINDTAILNDASLEQAAFVLVIARLVNCATCNANSFRASQGCAFCSKQALKRFRGSDEDLLRMYERAKQEVNGYFHQS